MANQCFLCLRHAESIDHLLLHCEKTRVLWELIFVLFGVFWVLSSLVKDTLLGWHGSFVGTKRRKVWQAIPLCLFWMVWKTRNNIAFCNEVFSIQKLKRESVCFLWSEAKVFVDEYPLTLVRIFEWLGTG